MIAVRGLKKRIGTQEILRGVDMSVAIGETLVIIGRSGGGKERSSQKSDWIDAAQRG